MKNKNKSDGNSFGKYFLSSLVLAQPRINILVSGCEGAGGERYVCNVRVELSNLGGKYTRVSHAPATCDQKEVWIK